MWSLDIRILRSFSAPSFLLMALDGLLDTLNKRPPHCHHTNAGDNAHFAVRRNGFSTAHILALWTSNSLGGGCASSVLQD
ncbi:rCG48375 [Rattus norvegicus]|uniref:RCG48375 n=1 Tax=Rattus norvegicus TaxID=10116 RepID=A6I0U2_RAT|nr:rCG48375 [Rattus norvegicus]